MDTSKSYILMCEKAYKHLKEPEKDDLGTMWCAWAKDGKRTVPILNRNWDRQEDAFPVYRQDQLQDILADLDNSGFYKQMGQLKHVLDMSIQEIGYGLTYEKLWLKVVMRKFNKVWNGTDWISA